MPAGVCARTGQTARGCRFDGHKDSSVVEVQKSAFLLSRSRVHAAPRRLALKGIRPVEVRSRMFRGALCSTLTAMDLTSWSARMPGKRVGSSAGLTWGRIESEVVHFVAAGDRRLCARLQAATRSLPVGPWLIATQHQYKPSAQACIFGTGRKRRGWPGGCRRHILRHGTASASSQSMCNCSSP